MKAYKFVFFLCIALTLNGMAPRRTLAEALSRPPAKKRRVRERTFYEQTEKSQHYIEAKLVLEDLGLSQEDIEYHIDHWLENYPEFSVMSQLISELAEQDTPALEHINRFLADEVKALKEALEFDYTSADEQALVPKAVESFIDKPRVIEALIFSMPEEYRQVAKEKLLRAAARSGAIDTLLFLVNKGADINAQDSYYASPLMDAAGFKRGEVVDHLLQMPGIETNAADSKGMTALMIAAVQGYDDIVQKLLQRPEVRSNIDQQSFPRRTALIYAASEGHLSVVEQLIQAGADVNAIDQVGMTALIYAARGGHLEIAKKLLEVPDIEVNFEDVVGFAALDYARQQRNQEMADLLREHGAHF